MYQTAVARSSSLLERLVAILAVTEMKKGPIHSEILYIIL